MSINSEMKLFYKILRYIGYILILPVSYLVISIILSFITVNDKATNTQKNHTIYLSSNGVHLEIIIQKQDLIPAILEGQIYNDKAQYFSFGWGDKNFYVETPTWGDFTLLNGLEALFFVSPSLLHVTRHSKTKKHWVAIKVNKEQLIKINRYINNTFKLDQRNQKILLAGLGYKKNDDFYEAMGSYTCFNTCNSWVNSALKQSSIKSCLWTPYDFGLLYIHN